MFRELGRMIDKNKAKYGQPQFETHMFVNIENRLFCEKMNLISVLKLFTRAKKVLVTNMGPRESIIGEALKTNTR